MKSIDREARHTPRPLRGIVIRRGEADTAGRHPPRIAAFIWGGKVRPNPTLPFGRWKGAA